MRRSGSSFSSGAAERLINARSGTSDAEVTVSKPSAQLLQNNTNQLDSRISSVSSIESIGLSADVVPAHMHRSPTMSPRLTYLRTLSNRMVSAGLNPLEPPPGLVEPPTFFPPVRMTFGSMPDLANKANSMGIVFTVWNTMMGSTLLVMPYTFNEAGWLLALILSVVCAATMRYTGGLILYYAEGLMADPAAEFADLARLHFGRAGHLLAFATGNFVVLAAAVAMHGYLATVLKHLIALPPAHGGFCVAAEGNFTHPGDSGGAVESPCLEPLLRLWTPVSDAAPPPFLVVIVLVVTLPLANLPSIRLLARLNTVGVFCFGIIMAFAFVSAGVAGVSRTPSTRMSSRSPGRPASSSAYSRLFFIHNAFITIMRSAAIRAQRPRPDRRVRLTWACYIVMGASACICPPLGDIGALSGPLARNGILSLEQPPAMAPVLIIARSAVLIQSMTVYPVLLFIVRSQVFTALYGKGYPGPLPVLVLSSLMATITTVFTALGVDIADVLKFAGAGGGLVCCEVLPALIHAKVSRERGALTAWRVLVVVLLCVFGVMCFALQIIPMGGSSGGGASHNATNSTTNSTDAASAWSPW